MARRLIAATASALLLIPSAPVHAVGELPDTGPLPGPGTGIPGAPSVPQVDLGEGGPDITPGEPKPGAGQGSPGGDGATPTTGAPASPPAVPDPPSRRRPAGDAPARASPPRAGQPAGRGATPKVARAPGRGPGERSSGEDSPRGGEPSVGQPDDPPAGSDVQASAIERIFDQVPTELLTALTVTTLLASALSLVWLRERYKVRAAKRKALIDPLTGIANRFAFEQRLAQEWKRARRYERPLGMLLLDLDGLKAVNDTHGHSAGDEMIRAVATGLAGDIREPDLVARLAGDEFVVLCPETGLPGMRQLAAKLEELLERGGFRASIGCAEAVDDDDRPEAMVVRADESMYRAKQSRRGRRSGAAADPTASLGFASAT